MEAVSENEIELRGVVKMIRHPKFEAKTFNNDIAVLKFDDPVSFSRSIGPVCLPQSGKRRLFIFTFYFFNSKMNDFFILSKIEFKLELERERLINFH